MTTTIPADTATFRILVADPIAADGIARLQRVGSVDVATGLSSADLLSRIAAYDALVVRSETQVTATLLSAATRLRVVGRAGVGVDNIDLDAATQHGVLVLNAPTGNTIAAAEHAIAMMLASARNLAAADATIRAGRWERKAFMGTELRGKTLGLVGLGKIGFEVARIAGQGLQMRIIAHDPLVTRERAEQAGAELVDLPELLAMADIVSVHVPLTPATRGMIAGEQLRTMKASARVINVARGGIVDEAALAEAVRSGTIAGAAVDVFTTEPPPPEHPLVGVDGIVVTPHLGASTVEAQVSVAADVADQIVEFLGGGLPRFAVNAPTVLPDELAQLQPYMHLAGRMGSLAGQLVGAAPQRIVCTYTGDLAQAETTVLTAEALRGFFQHFTETRVNPVNARSVARAHGVEVEERRSSHSTDYVTAMSIEIAGERPFVVTGTEFEGAPRITRIEGFRVNLVPEGNFLIVTHTDRPGVIAALSAVLAKNDINIAGIQLGRDRPRGKAVMVMEVDEAPGAALLDELRERAGLDTLRTVQLRA